jgi:hypothetical protein
MREFRAPSHPPYTLRYSRGGLPAKLYRLVQYMVQARRANGKGYLLVYDEYKYLNP